MDPAVDHSDKKRSDGEQSPDHASYPKLDPEDVDPPPPPPPSFTPAAASQSHPPSSDPPSTAREKKSVTWSSVPTAELPSAATTMPPESNPYVTAPDPAASSKSRMETVRNVLGRWGKKVGEKTKKAEDLGRNVWQHLKTGPSVADAAMGRIAQGTKVIAEGGYEKIFRQTFDTLQEEELRKSYACYLSTSAGPVMGILYLSTAKLAFCSDNPLSYKVGDENEWSYYKVGIPLHQLRAVNPSASKASSAEKYIQIVSIDNHEFWFLGFFHYDSAVKNLQEALLGVHTPPP